MACYGLQWIIHVFVSHCGWADVETGFKFDGGLADSTVHEFKLTLVCRADAAQFQSIFCNGISIESRLACLNIKYIENASLHSAN